MVVRTAEPKRIKTNSFKFAGQRGDLPAGKVFLRARYYHPDTGRFSKLDPFAGNREDPQSLHKYAYVHGDPINGIDPTGQYLESLLQLIFLHQVELKQAAAPYDNRLASSIRANVVIAVSSTGMPATFDRLAVEQKMNEALRKSGWPVFVSIGVTGPSPSKPGVSIGMNKPADLGFSEADPLFGKPWWRHNVVWEEKQGGLYSNIRRPAASTAERTKTQLFSKNVSRNRFIVLPTFAT